MRGFRPCVPKPVKGAQSAMCCKAANEYTASFPSRTLSEGNLEPNTHRVLCDESSIPRVDDISNPTSSWSPDYQNHPVLTISHAPHRESGPGGSHSYGIQGNEGNSLIHTLIVCSQQCTAPPILVLSKEPP